jgi:hypothetical protein
MAQTHRDRPYSHGPSSTYGLQGSQDTGVRSSMGERALSLDRIFCPSSTTNGNQQQQSIFHQRSGRIQATRHHHQRCPDDDLPYIPPLKTKARSRSLENAHPRPPAQIGPMRRRGHNAITANDPAALRVLYQSQYSDYIGTFSKIVAQKRKIQFRRC